MNIGAILVGIALLVLVAAYVARPLFERQASGSNGRATSGSPRAQLAARRDAIYALIRELDADHRTGKVNEEDYRAQRERYVTEGVALLKRLDALSGENGRAALEAEIEAAVLALRQKPGLRQPKVAQKPGFYEPTKFCTQCGHPADPEDSFCSQCGASLKRTA